MKLATIHLGAQTQAVVHDGQHWRGLEVADLNAYLLAQDPQGLIDRALASGPVLTQVRYAPVVPRPAKVICCGLNYRDHILETGRSLPEYPTLFSKFADSLVGAGETVVITGSTQVDWEAELAVVVGATLRRADLATAEAAIAGYTIANDVSMRDWQRRTLQWFQGKAWDRSTPVGPVLVTPDECDLSTAILRCQVNGQQVQSAPIHTQVFGPAELLAYISSFTTLRPGDLVLTGTPGGVGMAMCPPRYLTDHDTVSCHIDGLGSLTTTFTTSGDVPEADRKEPTP